MTRLVLAGLGHAHLFVLEALTRGRLPPARVVLVTPDDAYFYSGMVSGVIAGRYRPGAPCLRPAALAEAAGAEWVRGTVARVDAAAGCVERVMRYDLLSLGVGSSLKADEIPGSAEHGTFLKPFRDSICLGDAAAAVVETAPVGRAVRIVIVGGGAGGWEIGVCLDAALRRRFGLGRHRITLLHGGDTVLSEHPARVREKGSEILRERAIDVQTGARVERADSEGVVTAGGAMVPYDLLVWATGPRAPALFRESGLPVDEHGYLRVEPTFQATGHPDIFGAGDCVSIAGQPWVNKAGCTRCARGRSSPATSRAVSGGSRWGSTGRSGSGCP